MVYSMKVTFELPESIVEHMRLHIPSGERSRFAAAAIAEKLKGCSNALEQAAKKANKLRKVNEETNPPESLNGYEN
jgi:Arc/MetJ-type ribon-helix-helix transcriptional regulator